MAQRQLAVKMITGMIMLIVLVSRFFKLPVYFSNLGMIETLPAAISEMLSTASFSTLARGITADRKAKQGEAGAAATP